LDSLMNLNYGKSQPFAGMLNLPGHGEHAVSKRIILIGINANLWMFTTSAILLRMNIGIELVEVDPDSQSRGLYHRLFGGPDFKPVFRLISQRLPSFEFFGMKGVLCQGIKTNLTTQFFNINS